VVGDTFMTLRRTTLLVAVGFLFVGLGISKGNAQQIVGTTKAVQLTGLTGVRENTKGTLRVENGILHFVHGKASADVSAASIQDVVTGTDSRESVGKTVGMVSMAAPYGGGRFLSLFRTKIDTLTIQYRDENGGLHGAVFTMPAGAAEGIKKELVAQGAHASRTGEPTAAVPAASPSPRDKEQEP